MCLEFDFTYAMRISLRSVNPLLYYIYIYIYVKTIIVIISWNKSKNKKFSWTKYVLGIQFYICCTNFIRIGEQIRDVTWRGMLITVSIDTVISMPLFVRLSLQQFGRIMNGISCDFYERCILIMSLHSCNNEQFIIIQLRFYASWKFCIQYLLYRIGSSTRILHEVSNPTVSQPHVVTNTAEHRTQPQNALSVEGTSHKQ